MFGYIRPTKLYTPWTNYQNSYGKIGYGVLKRPTRTTGGRKEQTLHDKNSQDTNNEEKGKIIKKHKNDTKLDKLKKCCCSK